MKLNQRTFLSFIIIFYSLTSVGQVSINSSHMPQSGDSLIYSISVPDTAVLLSYSQSGANLQWNFDSLIPVRQGVSEFINSNQSPYNISSRIGEKLADALTIDGFELKDVYNFYTNNTSRYQLDYRGISVPNPLPFGGPTIPFSVAFNDPDEIYKFPLNYQNRDTSTFEFIFNNIPTAYYASSGQRINEVEAWGNIRTPFGAFNCIKVKTDIISYDSVSFNGTTFGDTTHRREYKWISPQEAIPIAILNGNVVNGIFIPLNMQYRDSARAGVPNLFVPLALFNADTTEVKIGETLTFNNLTISLSSANYRWNFYPSTVQYTNGTNANSESPAVIFADSGFYDVELIASNPQGTDTLRINNYIEVKGTVSLAEFSKNKSADWFELYPNPIKRGESIQIKSKKQFNRVELYNSNSQLISSQDVNNQKSSMLSLPTNLSSGIYFISIELDGQQFLKKLLIH